MKQVLYKIRNWAACFEVAQSRAATKLTWVAIPNKHDGKNYGRLIVRPDGAKVYGIWTILVQVASKCQIRGVLADEDGPFTAQDIETKTKLKAKDVEHAFEVLSSPAINWLEKSYSDTDSRLDLESSLLLLQDSTVQDRTVQGCAEPQAASTPDNAEQVLEFPTCHAPTKWPLRRSKMLEYQETFSGLDVLAECKKARQWLFDNPTKRKTPKGMERFLGSWLGRAQDRGGKYTPKTESDDSIFCSPEEALAALRES